MAEDMEHYKRKLQNITIQCISEMATKLATSAILLEAADEKELSNRYASLNAFMAHAVTMLDIRASASVMDQINVQVPLVSHDVLIKEAIKCCSDLSDAINDPKNVKDNDRSREALGALRTKLNEYIDMNQKWLGEYEIMRKEYEA